MGGYQKDWRLTVSGTGRSIWQGARVETWRQILSMKFKYVLAALLICIIFSIEATLLIRLWSDTVKW